MAIKTWREVRAKMVKCGLVNEEKVAEHRARSEAEMESREYSRVMWERDEARRYIQKHLGETHLFLHLAAVDKTEAP